MGRLPKIRVSYTDDANFLLRLINALERDTTRSAEWRRDMIAKCKDLSGDLLNAPVIGGKAKR